MPNLPEEFQKFCKEKNILQHGAIERNCDQELILSFFQKSDYELTYDEFIDFICQCGDCDVLTALDILQAKYPKLKAKLDERLLFHDIISPEPEEEQII